MGAEKCILFPCLFLLWLPRQQRVLLARADLSDLKVLAKQVEVLWTSTQLRTWLLPCSRPAWIEPCRHHPRW